MQRAPPSPSSPRAWPGVSSERRASSAQGPSSDHRTHTPRSPSRSPLLANSSQFAPDLAGLESESPDLELRDFHDNAPPRISQPIPTRSRTARRSDWENVIQFDLPAKLPEQQIPERSGRPQDIEQRDSSEGWAKIDKGLKVYDEVKIRDLKEDMDTLLVFAGLFSAILTAFNIESYKNLQQDPSELATTLLILIAQSVNSFVINGSMVNSTIPFNPEMPKFSPSASAIRINSLWFVSLVLSIATAALAMLVKQWLREYPPGDWLTAQEHIRIRNYRFAGLLQWRVFEIAAALPLVLQLSLAFFLLGLSEFTRVLHPIVGWLTTSLVILWFLVFLATTLAPFLTPRCPYKTPFLQPFIHAWRKGFYARRGRIALRLSGETGWDYFVHEGIVQVDPSLDVIILQNTDAFFRDDSLLPAIRSCLSDFRIEYVLQWIRSMVAARSVSGQEPETIDEFTLSVVARNGLIPTVQIIFDAMERDLNFNMRFNRASFDSGLSPHVATAMVSLLRRAMWVKELVGPQSMFGSFVNKLLGLGAAVRRDVIGEVMARDWFIPTANPWITEKDMMVDVIKTTTELMDSYRPISPDLLTCSVLNLTLHTDDQVLVDLKPELNEIFRALASRLAEPVFVALEDPELRRDAGVRTCLYICALLDERLPDFVDRNLVESLKALTRQPDGVKPEMP